MAGTMLAAPLTKVLVARLDRAYVASGGFVIAAAGFASLSRVHAHSPIWFILIAATVYAGGIVGVMSVGNELIMGAVPPARAGAAAAVVETASELGGALGMAVLGSIGIAAYQASLTASAPGGTPPAALAAARDTLGGAVTVAGRLPGPLGNGLLEAARTAFTLGLNQAALGAAIVMALAAVLSAVYFRGVQWTRPPPPSPGRPAPRRVPGWPPDAGSRWPRAHARGHRRRRAASAASDRQPSPLPAGTGDAQAAQIAGVRGPRVVAADVVDEIVVIASDVLRPALGPAGSRAGPAVARQPGPGQPAAPAALGASSVEAQLPSLYQQHLRIHVARPWEPRARSHSLAC